MAQPKAVAGFGNYRSTAETITSYQNGLRGDGSFKPNRIGCTFPKSPTLKTKDRAKPRELHSMEGQAVQGTDDVKKYVVTESFKRKLDKKGHANKKNFYGRFHRNQTILK